MVTVLGAGSRLPVRPAGCRFRARVDRARAESWDLIFLVSYRLPARQFLFESAQVNRLDEEMVEPRMLGASMIQIAAISCHCNEH